MALTRKQWLIWAVFVCLFALGLWHSLNLGLAYQDDFEMQLLLQVRLPRIIASLAVGSLLALCGLTMQSLFRNPLAEPSLIGISGGAALGAALGFFLGLSLFNVQLLASVCALVTILIVSLLSKNQSSNQLILAGVAINALCGSLLSLLLTQSNNDSLRTITFWLMGSLGHLNWPQVIFLCVLSFLTWTLLFPAMRFLNQLLLGDANAYYAGYAVKTWFFALLLFTTVMCALAVAQTGSIGFIALMAPHIARLMVGGNNRILFWAAPLIGAFLCMLADDISRNALYPVELPIGIVTSLLGVPFFLWLLNREGKKR